MIDPVEVVRALVAGHLRRVPRAYALARRLTGAPTVNDKDDAGYVEAVYRAFAPLCTGGRTLEIGPGSNLGVSLLLARDGCEAVAIDLVDLRTAGLESLYEQVVRLPRLETAPADSGADAAGDPARAQRVEAHTTAGALPVARAAGSTPQTERGLPPVRYVRSSIERLPFADRSFDFIFSNACFEHFRRPAVAVGELWRVLRPGGRTVHQIDLRDHRHMDAPLRFLRYGDRTWSLMNPPGPAYMNRWRLQQYVRAFESRGFQVDVTVNMTATPAQLAELAHAAPRFRGLRGDDASAISCLLVASRPRP